MTSFNSWFKVLRILLPAFSLSSGWIGIGCFNLTMSKPSLEFRMLDRDSVQMRIFYYYYCPCFVHGLVRQASCRAGAVAHLSKLVAWTRAFLQFRQFCLPPLWVRNCRDANPNMFGVAAIALQST